MSLPTPVYEHIPYPYYPRSLRSRLLEPRPDWLPRIPTRSGAGGADDGPEVPERLDSLAGFTLGKGGEEVNNWDREVIPRAEEDAFRVRDYTWLGLERCSETTVVGEGIDGENGNNVQRGKRVLEWLTTPRTCTEVRGREITINRLTPSAITAILLSGVYDAAQGWDTFPFDIWFLRCLGVNSGDKPPGGALEIPNIGVRLRVNDESQNPPITPVWGTYARRDGCRYYALSLPYLSLTSTVDTTRNTPDPDLAPGPHIRRRKPFKLTFRAHRFTLALTTYNATATPLSNAHPWTLTTIGAPLPRPPTNSLRPWLIRCTAHIMEHTESILNQLETHEGNITVRINGKRYSGRSILRFIDSQMLGVGKLLEGCFEKGMEDDEVDDLEMDGLELKDVEDRILRCERTIKRFKLLHPDDRHAVGQGGGRVRYVVLAVVVWFILIVFFGSE